MPSPEGVPLPSMLMTFFAFPGNAYEVGVHIADVSYFVPEESDLDKVAAERATSVYLVQKVKIQVLGSKSMLLLSSSSFSLFMSP